MLVKCKAFSGFSFIPLLPSAFAHFSCCQPQALSLLLALILRATVSTREADFDYEDECDARGRTWEPLINPQSGQASGSGKGDNRGNHSDIWSSRMREKVSGLEVLAVVSLITFDRIESFNDWKNNVIL